MKRSAKKFSLILVALLCAVVTVVATATGAFATATEVLEQKAQHEANKLRLINNAIQLEYTNRYDTYIEALKTDASAVMKNRAGTTTNWNLNADLADLVAGGYLPAGVTPGNYTVTANATNPKHLDIIRSTLPAPDGIETAVAELIPSYNEFSTFDGTNAVMLVTLPAATSDASHFLRSDMPNQVAYDTATGTGCTLEWVGGGGVIRGLGDLTTDKLTESTAGAGITVGSNMNLGAYKLTATQLEATSALKTATLETTGNATLGGNASVAGTLSVTGGTTLNGTVTANANITATGRTLTIGTINGVAVTLTAPNDTTNALTVSNGVVDLAGADKITTGGSSGTTDAQANTGALVDGRLRIRDLSIYKDGKYQDMTALLDSAGGGGVGAEGGVLDVKTLRVNKIVFYDNSAYEEQDGVYTVKDDALNDVANARLEYGVNSVTGKQQVLYKVEDAPLAMSYYKDASGAILQTPFQITDFKQNFKYGFTPENMDAKPQTSGGTARIDVPPGVNAMRIQLWAQANGGYSDAVFPVVQGETYYIFAGLGVLKAPDSWNSTARLTATAPARASNLGADGVAGHLHPVNHAIMFVGNKGGSGGNGAGAGGGAYGSGGGYYGIAGSAGGRAGGPGTAHYSNGGGGGAIGCYFAGILYASSNGGVAYSNKNTYSYGSGGSLQGTYSGATAPNGSAWSDRHKSGGVWETDYYYGGGGGGGGGLGYYGGSGGGAGSYGIKGHSNPAMAGYGGGGGGGGGGSGYVNMAPFYPQPNSDDIHNTTTTLVGKPYFPKTLNVTLMPELANKQSYLVRQETNIIRPNYPLTDAAGGASATMAQGYCRVTFYESWNLAGENTLKSIGTKLGSRLTYSAIAVAGTDAYYFDGYKLQTIAIPAGAKRMRVMLRGGGNTYSEGIVDVNPAVDNGKYYAYINPTIVSPSGTGIAALYYGETSELVLADLGECKTKTCDATQLNTYNRRLKDFNTWRVAVANAPQFGLHGPSCYSYEYALVSHTTAWDPTKDTTCFTAYNGYDRTFGHGTWDATSKRIVPAATEGTNGWGFVSGHAYTSKFQGKKFYNTIVTSYFPEGTANTIYVEFFQ